MALISTPPSLGNPFAAVGPPSSFVWQAIFDPLVAPGDDGALRPVLALTWTATSPTVWRFTLRPNVQFSNGEALDAEAVAATLMWLVGEVGRRTVIGADVATIVQAKAVDPLTVDIITSEPDAVLPKRLAPVAIVAPKAWADLGPDAFAQNPVGTGPFMLESWQTAQGQIALVANASSWRRPKIERLTFIVTPDSVARAQSILAGQIDIANVLSPDIVAQFETSEFRVVESPTPQVYALAFNTVGRLGSAIADHRVRQAINLAVDKNAIVDVMMHGRMRVAGQGATPMTFGYDPSIVPYAFDPDRARALLREAGVEGRLSLSAEIVTNGMPGDPAFLSLIQQDLQRIGVDLEIRAIPFPDWLRKYLAGTFTVDMFGLSWNGAPSYDSARAAEYFSCAKPRPFFCDPSLDPLFAAARREFDVEARRRILFDLARRLHDDPPALFLFEVADLALVSPAVRNYRV